MEPSKIGPCNVHISPAVASCDAMRMKVRRRDTSYVHQQVEAWRRMLSGAFPPQMVMPESEMVFERLRAIPRRRARSSSTSSPVQTRPPGSKSMTTVSRAAVHVNTMAASSTAII